jgi:hypothetical protein
MSNAKGWCLAVVLGLMPMPAQGQSPTPSPSAKPQPGETSLQQATPPTGPRSGRARAKEGPPAPATATRGYSGSLNGVRALEIGDGRARLVLAGGERVVVPGTVIGTDTVKSITPGRIVLRRSAQEAEGGDAFVIVSFDAQGRTVVHVVAAKDPTAQAPAEVK